MLSHSLRPQKLALLFLVLWLLGVAGAQAQTATPAPAPSPTASPAPTEPPAILLILPTATPVPAPQGTPAAQFWQTYRPLVIAGLVTGLVGILVGVFLTSIAETIKKGLSRLFHWLFDRIASSVLVRWRYDKVYRRTLANSLQVLPGSNLVDRPLRLDKMYVPALLTEEIHPDIKEDNTPYATQDQIRRQQLARKVGPWEAVQRFHRFVVLGGPGAGKTTYLYYLAYHCALRQRVELQHYLPIFIRFSDHITQLNELSQLEAIFPVILHKYNFPNADRFLERQIKAGRCLILLDGLDEVPSEDDHKRMIALVQDFANRCLQEKQIYGGNILVVSSRKYNYDRRQPLQAFAMTEVMEFDNDTIERFIHNWFEGKLNHLADELMIGLRRNQRFLELARNPLLLLLIARYYEQGRNLPRQRADLYDSCINARIVDWNTKQGTHGGKFGKREKVQLLQSLALHIAEHEVEKLLRHIELLKLVEDFARSLQLLKEGVTSEQLLDEIVDTSSLIQEWAINRYGFSHQTLQEFFVADAVKDRGPEPGAELLANYFANSAWREIVLLYSGLVNNAAPLLGRLVAQAQQAEPQPDLWLLAGQCLAEGARLVPEAGRRRVAGRLVALLQTELPAQERGEAIANCQSFAPDLLPELLAPLRARGQAADLFLAAELLAPVADEALKTALSQQLLLLAQAGDMATRQAAVVALGWLRVAAVAGETMLLRLQDANPTTRAEAALALGRLGAADAATTAALGQLYEQAREDGPRHAALQALLALGQAAVAGMVPIAAGEFLLGSLPNDREAGENEKPQHLVYLPAYFMDKTPVTNRQYGRFMAAGGYANRAYWVEAAANGRWRDGKFIDYNDKPHTEPVYWQDARWNSDEQPVVGVSWYEALAYARWAGKRLPTEAEWEKAASWQPGAEAVKRRYPWGDDWRADHANTEEAKQEKTTAVGRYSPRGDSAYGLVDMGGNVWEWCSTRWDNEKDVPYSYPYTPDDGREDLSGGDKVYRVLRGGSWYSDQKGSRCAVRNWFDPWDWFNDWGFRCCATDSLSNTGSES